MRSLAAILSVGVLGCGLAVSGQAQTAAPAPQARTSSPAAAASGTVKAHPMQLAMAMDMPMPMAGQSMQGMDMPGMKMTPQKEINPKGFVDAPVTHEAGVPAFHRQMFKGPVPKTLPPGDFSDPRVQAAYAMAAQVRRVLYQMPCYCHCDQEVGHRSLLDCYRGDHASICEVCLMEGVYAYEQTKAGRSPGQIRAAIERGEWKSVNLNSLLSPRHY